MDPRDVHEIQNLYAAYNFAIDFGDAEAWADCFTDDGELDPGLGPSTSGREALVEFAAATHAMLPGARHHVLNLVIEGDEAEARGRCYLQMLNTAGGAGATALVISGVYDDTLAKTADGWRFVRRAMTPDT